MRAGGHVLERASHVRLLAAVLALLLLDVGALVRRPLLARLRHAEAAELPPRHGTQWFPYLEWSLTNPSWSGNAFDLVASVTFVHGASGERRTTQMFHAGADRWAFRFTATRTGTWTFSTASEDPDLHGHRGTVTIAPNPVAEARGFVKNFGEQWGWEGTEQAVVPQFVMFRPTPRAYHDNPSRVDDAIREFFHGHGFNGFHTGSLRGYWFDIDGPAVVSASMVNPDPRTFEALEQLITKVHAAGGMVHLWMWGDHERKQTPLGLAGGINGPEDRRLQRYVGARLGPLPGWTMGYGFDLDEWVSASQLKSWRDYMHEHLGWRHFLGGRPAGPNSGTDHSAFVDWNTSLDYSSYEHHKPTYDVYVAALHAVPGQPVFSEDRFRVREEDSRLPAIVQRVFGLFGAGSGGPSRATRRQPKDYDEDETRRGLWHSTMAGGVANIWGNLRGVESQDHGSAPYPKREQLKTYSVFFNDHGRFVRGMARANGLGGVDTLVLRHGEDRLIFYREATSSLEVDLSGMTGPQPAVAVDTKTSYAEIALGTLTPTRQRLTLPRTSDWAIAVGVFGREGAATERQESAVGGTRSHGTQADVAGRRS